MFLRKLLQVLCSFLLLFVSAGVFAQNKTVTGRVTDSSGRAVVGASVTVQGQTKGVVTGTDGTYSIAVPTNASSLVVSSVGYAAQEISIANGTTANATLQATAGSLNEVVVIGYGTARRRDVTGAVATVTSKDFVKGPITSPEQLIAGKVAGVQISTNGGAPGSGSRILIRGGASLNAGSDPLIVIDGVPVDGGVAGSSNPLNLINPNDIETFTVLKDPSAAAIYGSRGSNGVILITTKKGRAGKVRFGLTSNSFVQSPSRKVDVLSADQLREVIANQGVQADLGKLGGGSTDWQKEVFSRAFGQDLNLSASGAALNNKLPFRVSGNYLNQNGILNTGNFQRQSLGLNLSPKFFDNNLSIDFNAKGVRTTNRFADEGAIGAAITFDPTQPVRTGSDRFGGYFEYLEEKKDIGLVPKDLAPRNPVGLLEQRDNNSEVYRLLGNVQFDYRLPFIKGLRANVNLGLDAQRGSGTDIMSDSAGSSYRNWIIGRNAANTKDSITQYGGFNNYYKSKSFNKLLDAYLNYTTDVKAINSRIELMGGYGYQDFEFTSYNIPGRYYNGVTNETTVTNRPPSEQNGYTLISYYGRFVYTLANRYILKFDARTDGISKYNPNDRWGFFPALSFAWRIKEENFLRNADVVSDLKFRIGYGVTGQQAGVGFYEYVARYTYSNPAAQYQLGNSFYTLYRPEGYDPNLKWETTRNLNVALDFGLLKNRINGSVDVFRRKSKDLLNVIPVFAGSNFVNLLRQNVGSVESNGVEVSLNAVPVQRRNLTWDFGFNFTYANPEITNLLGRDDPRFRGNRVGGISGGTGNTIQVNAVGGRPNAFYVYKQIYDQHNKPIDGLYEDLNRDGVINENDLYAYKSPDPNFFMGFSSNLSVGKWSGGFVARAYFENYVYNNVASNLGVLRGIINPQGYINNGSVDYLNTGFLNNQYFSDYYIQNASFLRMDNVNVGYNAGQVVRGANLRISFNVQNVFVVTKYKGIDPEINGGIDNQFYPRPRTYTLGLNLDF